MFVTLFGIVILVRLMHPLKASLPMPVTLSGIMYFEQSLFSGYLMRYVASLEKRTPSIELYAVFPSDTSMLVRCLQWLKTLCQILVTLSGIVMCVRLSHR